MRRLRSVSELAPPHEVSRFPSGETLGRIRASSMVTDSSCCSASPTTCPTTRLSRRSGSCCQGEAATGLIRATTAASGTTSG